MLRKKSILILFTIFVVFTAIFFRYILTYTIPLYNLPSFSQAVYDRSGKLLRLTLSSDEKYRLWKPLGEISKDLIEATIKQEDQYFYWHLGVNPISVFNALQRNVSSTHRIGASTITMQLARLRFGLYTRSFYGKLRQIAYAFLLEAIYSKDEILEAYLNLAPYGGNIEGVGAASIIYFNKAADYLSQQEAFLLSVIPQDPNQRLPTTGKNQDELWSAIRRLSKRIIDQDLSIKFIPLFSKKNLPNLAPHYVQRLIDAFPFQNEIIGTLDYGLQKRVETQVQQFIERNKKIGISNSSVILVHHKTMEVRAYVGSADYFSNDIDGAFDGIKGRRSPGSALKPFIYGIAIDKGFIHPQTLLKDTLYIKTSYNPENFDKEFVGPISATDALVHSRNVPAVELLNKITPSIFYQFLKDAKISQLQNEEFYGLSLALGGVEVRLDELVSLYSMLSNRGLMYPIRYSSSVVMSNELPVQLMSSEASYLVIDMLRSNPRPSFDLGKANNTSQIPWKTGTSFGCKDAWAVGLVGPYVLGVWVGNFDAKGNPAFIGRDAAGPLFFSIVDSLKSQEKLEEDYQISDLNLKKISVCALSGDLPNPVCPHRKETWFIPGKSPIKTCPIHRKISINPDTGLRSCNNFDTGKVYEIWPSDLLTLFEQAGLKRDIPPPFENNCGSYQNSAIKIISPQEKLIYAVRNGDTIPFRASSDSGHTRVHWFIDSTLIGSSNAGEDFLWKASPGYYELSVVDEMGGADSQSLHVEDIGINE